MGARILTGDNGAATTEPEEPQQRGYEMNDLVGQKTIPLDDPFWLSIMENLDETLEQLDTGYEAMQMIHVSCKRLSENWHRTNNLRHQTAVLCALLEMILEQAGCGEKSVPSSAAERLRGGGHHGHRSSKEISIEISEMAVNLMFLTRVFFKHLIENCEGPKRRKALSLLPISEASSSSSSSSQERGAGRGEVAITIPIRPKESKGDKHGRQVEEEATNGKATNGTALTLERIKAASRDTDLQHRLFVNIIRIITTLPVTETTYEVHIETLNFAMVLASEQMYVQEEVIMQQSAAEEGQGHHSASNEAIRGQYDGWFISKMIDTKVTDPCQVMSALIRNFYQIPDGIANSDDGEEQGPTGFNAGDGGGGGGLYDENGVVIGTSNSSGDDAYNNTSTPFISHRMHSKERRTSMGGKDSLLSMATVTSTVKSVLLLPVMLPIYMFNFIFGRRRGRRQGLQNGEGAFGSHRRAHALGVRASLLLQILIYQSHAKSPYRSLMSKLTDRGSGFDEKVDTKPSGGYYAKARYPSSPSSSKSPSSSPPPSSSSSFVLSADFEELYQHLTDALPQEWAIVALYSLLYHNKSFKQFVFAKSDVDTIVVPLLQMLHLQSDLQANKVYMALVILVILTEDASFSDTLHTRLTMEKVPWFTHRSLNDISLGSLSTVVLVRTVKKNMAQGRELHLVTNCLGALVNMAPNAAQLHPAAAQQITELIALLTRRFIRVLKTAAEAKQGAAANDGGDYDEGGELEMVSEVVRLSLQIAAASLNDRALASNKHLIYSLLYQRSSALLPLLQSRRFDDIVVPLNAFLDAIETGISEEETNTGVEATVRLIEGLVLHSKTTLPSIAISPAKFQYEEQESSESFFIPYLWDIILSLDAIPFLVTKDEDGAEDVYSNECKEAKQQGTAVVTAGNAFEGGGGSEEV